MTKKIRTVLLGSVAAAASFVNAAYAQVDEIIVTARKVEENQQDVPIAITALSGEKLADTGATNFAQAGDRIPNVQIDSVSPINGSSNTPNINIRGIGTTDFLLTIDPSVGVYVDGVYVARSVGGLFDLLDLEQVEVLRGPQGTLFGRNTVGGAVQLISKKPSDQFRASAELTTGSGDRFDARGSISGPLAENLFAGLSFSRKRRDGYGEFRDFFADNPGLITPADIAAITVYDELTGTLLSGNATGLPPGQLIANGDIVAFPDAGEQPGNENNHSGRLSVVWEPADKLSFNLVGDYSHTDETGPALVLLDIFQDDLSAPGAGPNPVTGNDFAPNLAALHAIFGFDAATIPYTNDQFLIGDFFSTYATGPSANVSDTWGAALTAEYEVNDNVTLKSITAYRELDALFGQDPDHSPFTLDAHTNDYDHEQFTQEVQVIGSFEDFTGTFGGYYISEEGLDRVIVPLLHGLATLDEANEIDNSAWAIFGQGTYDLTDQTSITGGVRYTNEDKGYIQTHLDCGPANALGVPPGNVVPTLEGDLGCNSLSTGTASLDFSNVTYTASLAHRWNEALMTYFSWSTGFKSGGFTGRTVAFVPSQTPLPFNEEKARTIEVGLKSDFENARINAAFFWTDFDDLQLVVQSGVAPITTNASDARIRGVEIEGLYNPAPGLNLTAALGYLDAEYKSPPPFPVASELANAPEFTANWGVDYEHSLGDVGTLQVIGDFTYKSTVYNNAENTEELVQPSVVLVNASAKLRVMDERYAITIGGRNLTDERNLITGFFQPGVGYTEGVYNRPREWYLSVSASL